MTTTMVILACLGGIAGSAMLIFAVEMLVAFVLHRGPAMEQVSSRMVPTPIRSAGTVSRVALPTDKAA